MFMNINKYYFRHKIDQSLYAYLELGETWENTFLMKYRLTETKPHSIKSGSLEDNIPILLDFKDAVLTATNGIIENKKFEWIIVQPGVQLDYVTKTFIESYINSKNGDNLDHFNRE